MNEKKYILTVNAGSSSIKTALYDYTDTQLSGIVLSATFEHIGSEKPAFIIKQGKETETHEAKAEDFHQAVRYIIGWLEEQGWIKNVAAIGHRIVHGMHHTEAEIITDELLNDLRRFISFDPDHLPSEIAIIKTLKDHYPDIVQTACFDTAFHTTIPEVAKRFAIPSKYYDMGIRRYGFHGISYSYLLQELKRISPSAGTAKIIMAHLGNGAGLAAINNGICIDTSMGFTPAGGIVMSSRSGDLDPGAAWYLMQEGMNAKQFNYVINHESGLLGISGLSADMQVLLKKGKENKGAALAIEIFCYQIRKFTGAYTAALEGLDILVFSGGIGEHASEIRSRICKGLQYLGVTIDEEKNSRNEMDISSPDGKVKVYVIPTNEELMIAQTSLQLYKKNETKNI